MLTDLNEGESCLFDTLNDDGADASGSHKVELGKLLAMLMMAMMQMMMKSARKSALLFQIIQCIWDTKYGIAGVR